MQIIVLDTSVFVEYIRTKRGMFIDLISLWKEREEEVVLQIPTAVFYELWCGTSMTSQQELRRVEEFLAQFEVIPLSSEMAKKAGELKRLKLADGIDAMIAATTLLQADYLATLNTKHFKNIPGLKLWKP